MNISGYISAVQGFFYEVMTPLGKFSNVPSIIGTCSQNDSVEISFHDEEQKRNPVIVYSSSSVICDSNKILSSTGAIVPVPIVGIWSQAQANPQRNNCWAKDLVPVKLQWDATVFATLTRSVQAPLGMVCGNDSLYVSYQTLTTGSGGNQYTIYVDSYSLASGNLLNSWSLPPTGLEQSAPVRPYGLFLNEAISHNLLVTDILNQSNSNYTGLFFKGTPQTVINLEDPGAGFISSAGQHILKSVYQFNYTPLILGHSGTSVVVITPGFATLQGSFLGMERNPNTEKISQSFNLDPRNFLPTLSRPMIASCDSGPAISGFPANLTEKYWTLAVTGRQQFDPTSNADLFIANEGNGNHTPNFGPLSTDFSRKLQMTIFDIDTTGKSTFPKNQYLEEIDASDTTLYQPAALMSYFADYYKYAIAAANTNDPTEETSLPIEFDDPSTGGSQKLQWGGTLTSSYHHSVYIAASLTDFFIHRTPNPNFPDDNDSGLEGPRPIPDFECFRKVGISFFPRGGSNNPTISAAINSSRFTDGNRNNLHVFTDYLLDQGGNQHNGPTVIMDQNERKYFAYATPNRLLAGSSTYKLCGTYTGTGVTEGYGNQGDNTLVGPTPFGDLADGQTTFDFFYIPDLKFVWETTLRCLNPDGSKKWDIDFTNYVSGACLTETLNPIGVYTSDVGVGGTTTDEIPLVDNIWSISAGNGGNGYTVIFVIHDVHLEGPSHPPTACVSVIDGEDGTIYLFAKPLRSNDSLLSEDLYDDSGNILGYQGDAAVVLQGGACYIKAYTSDESNFGNPYCFIGTNESYLSNPATPNNSNHVWCIVSDINNKTATFNIRNTTDFSGESCPSAEEWRTFVHTYRAGPRMWLSGGNIMQVATTLDNP